MTEDEIVIVHRLEMCIFHISELGAYYNHPGGIHDVVALVCSRASTCVEWVALVCEEILKTTVDFLFFSLFILERVGGRGI